jgi:hypothetical protein
VLTCGSHENYESRNLKSSALMRHGLMDRQDLQIRCSPTEIRVFTVWAAGVLAQYSR